MSDYKTIQLTTSDDGTVATLTLARPEVRNAFDALLIQEMQSALDRIRGRIAGGGGPRTLVLTGTDTAFSAGADLNWMRSQKEATYEENVADAGTLAGLLHTLYTLPCVTIARVNGHAIGGGTGLVAACDIPIAVENAKFGFTEARLGLAPAVIAPYVIRRIGERHAREYFLTAALFDGAKAAEIGLVQQAVPAADLDTAIADRLAAIRSVGPEAVQACKELIAHTVEKPLSELRPYTSELIATLRVGEEGQEGIAAFLEKRKPSFGPQDGGS